MKDWHNFLYVENARIYQPVLEAGLSSAPGEARGLARIFERFGLRASAESRPRILDVCCGIGRHSVSLAKLGYEVVGFDFSPYFLKTARRLAMQEGLSGNVLRFYEGDTVRIQAALGSRGETNFDAVICMDSSIGRPSSRDEIDLVRSMHSLGREGSLLVIETANRDYFLKYQRFFSLPIVQSFSQGRLQRHLQAGYDARKKHIKGEWKFFRKLRNDDLKHLLSVKVDSNIHSQKDLRRIVERAGWKYLRSYGSIRRLNRLSSDSFHVVMVARKSD